MGCVAFVYTEENSWCQRIIKVPQLHLSSRCKRCILFTASTVCERDSLVEEDGLVTGMDTDHLRMASFTKVE